jgi:hypothetical protein
MLGTGDPHPRRHVGFQFRLRVIPRLVEDRLALLADLLRPQPDHDAETLRSGIHHVIADAAILVGAWRQWFAGGGVEIVAEPVKGILRYRAGQAKLFRQLAAPLPNGFLPLRVIVRFRIVILGVGRGSDGADTKHADLTNWPLHGIVDHRYVTHQVK